MDKVHLGPYTVTEIADKGLYRLQNDKENNLKKLYNGVLLKEYFPPVKAPEEEPSKDEKRQEDEGLLPPVKAPEEPSKDEKRQEDEGLLPPVKAPEEPSSDKIKQEDEGLPPPSKKRKKKVREHAIVNIFVRIIIITHVHV